MNTNSASAATPPRQSQKHQQSNLGPALTQFDHSNKILKQPPLIKSQPQTCLLTGDGERERSLTLGSEFDVGALTEPSSTVGDGGMSPEGTSTTEVSASTASSAHHNPTVTQYAVATYLPHFSEEKTTHSKSAAAAATKDSNSSSNNNKEASSPQLWTSMPTVGLSEGSAGQELISVRNGDTFGNSDNSSTNLPDKVMSSGSLGWQQQRLESPARERGDSTASQFLKGLYQQQLPPSQLVAHTPPTQMGTSYENNHFGKRMRAGVCSSIVDFSDSSVRSLSLRMISFFTCNYLTLLDYKEHLRTTPLCHLP